MPAMVIGVPAVSAVNVVPVPTTAVVPLVVTVPAPAALLVTVRSGFVMVVNPGTNCQFGGIVSTTVTPSTLYDCVFALIVN